MKQKNEIIEIETKIKKLGHKQSIIFKDLQIQNYVKIKKILMKKRKISRIFWNIINNKEPSKINSLKKENGQQSTNPEETIKVVEDQLGELFAKHKLDKNKKHKVETPKHQIKTKGITKEITMTEVKNI
jgi:hypothetical protein